MMENKTRWGITRNSSEKEGRVPKISRPTDEKYLQFIRILEKIPIFKGLNVDQFIKIINLCKQKTIEKGIVICNSGDESREMYILLKGCLRIDSSEGDELTKITSLGLVGEMGLFSDEKRSATVVTDTDSIILIISKTELMELFNKDCGIAIAVLTNVIIDLSKKLKFNNDIIAELRQLVMPSDYNFIMKKILK